jgi:hypothetical protein
MIDKTEPFDFIWKGTDKNKKKSQRVAIFE